MPTPLLATVALLACGLLTALLARSLLQGKLDVSRRSICVLMMIEAIRGHRAQLSEAQRREPNNPEFPFRLGVLHWHLGHRAHGEIRHPQ